MIKASSMKFWIILISACTVSTAIVLACAGDWGPEYGTSNFTPEIFVDSAYSPFFYSGQFYYGIGHDEAQTTRWKYDLIPEWNSWLNKALSWEKVDYLLNTAGPAAIDSAAKSSPPGKKVIDFFHYLRLAKQCEAFSLTPIPSSWEQDSTQKKTPFDARGLNHLLELALTTATDPFLQERYWFQLLRSRFYNGTPQGTIQVFDAYSQKFPKNKLWYRCLAYTAGAYRKQHDYAKANYYYSRVFDSCNELKTTAHYSFHPQEESDWQATLALCRTTEEKATLWQMLGIFYSDPIRAIASIYDLDPRSEKLELLLSRAVNVSEQRFGGEKNTDYDSPYKQNDSSDRALTILVSHIAAAGNTAKPWVWQLAAGYLLMLDHQYTSASSDYKKAESSVPRERLPQAQLRLLKLLNTIAAAHTVDQTLEQNILPELVWLDSSQKDNSFRSESAYTWMKKTMAAKYRLAGDKIKSECFVSRPAFYTDTQNVEGLKRFLSKPNRSPYEQLCGRFSSIQREDIFEYQAVCACLNDNIEEALTAIKQTPAAAKTILPANPFNARINDCHDCDQQAPQKIKYSKSDFLQKLKELKEKIAAGNDVCTNAILLGNAHYNITHFGNDRAFYDCKVLGDEHSSPELIDSIFRDRLINMTLPTKYYTLALNAARTDEQRTKCQYLLAKCQRNQWYCRDLARQNDTYDYSGQVFTAFDGFKALKQYSNTTYYQEVLRECGYFRTYIQKNK
jgi:hypothetical protein